MTRGRTDAARSAAVLFVVAFAIPACNRRPAPICRVDPDCGAGWGCVGAVCVPRKPSRPAEWAIQLAPAPESALALKEYPALTFTAEENLLKVDRPVPIEGTVVRAPAEGDTIRDALVRVIVSLRSTITGQPDLQIETDGAIKSLGGDIKFSLAIPGAAQGLPGIVQLLPPTPLDRIMAPWRFGVTLMTPLELAVPGAVPVLSVEGVLQTVLSEPLTGYVVRAFLADRVISNSAPTDNGGHFKVGIPAILTGGGTLEGVSLEVAPEDKSLPQPRVIFEKLTKSDLGVTMFPAHSQAQTFYIPVVENDTSEPIAGATIRFRTTLLHTVSTEFYYVREGQTGADGKAEVALLPGVGGDTQDYSVVVIPPANSRYAAQCVPSYSVAAPAGQVRVGAALRLLAKMEISGCVVRDDGQPLTDVRLTAMRDDPPKACNGLGASQSDTTLSGADGSYQLFLEPGRYHIDYVPPVGSPSPRITEKDLVIMDRTYHTFVLPRGFLVEGLVSSPDGVPVPACEVRVFDSDPAGAAGARGRARTGDDGRFRLILPDN